MSAWRAWLNKSNPTLLDQSGYFLLRILSLGYGTAIVLRNCLYDSKWKKIHHAGVPVISVGNLSVGGTGKSPTVAWLARWFRNRDARVAILSRGYGQLDDGRNDEALELELKLPDVPHLQNADRVASAELATDELEMQVLILDDGFQHRRLARQLDIVLIDATDSPASRWLLPAGLRREPLSSLRRAGFVIITRADFVEAESLQRLIDKVSRFLPREHIATAAHRPQCLLQFPNQRSQVERLRGQKVLAFCGIGNATAFFDSLKHLGAEIVDQKAWPDHHAYRSDDISWLCNWQRHHEDAVFVCTVKDWVKIQEAKLGQRELLALEIELCLLSGRSQLESLLEGVLSLSGS